MRRRRFQLPSKEFPENICDIIIPTFDNPQYLSPCVNSILMHTQSKGNLKIIIINNGSKEVENCISRHPSIRWIHAEKNLGWEGGLKLGLENSQTPFVCFMNDDVYIPYASSLWANKCLSSFNDPEVAAVGPSTNVVRGCQNIFLDQFAGYHSPYASLLIFFCVFIRRSHLDEVGGIDDMLPGGDDLDLSIRLRAAGKKLVIARDVFVFHHGFKTGERVRGGPNRPGGWNSRQMVENTNKALIQKHGFSKFIDCNNGGLTNPESRVKPSRDEEGNVVRRHVKGDVVYELGCGASKTVPNAIGIDRVKCGDIVSNLDGHKSVSDIQADVTEELPLPDESADTIICRHILEHCIDLVSTLKNWMKKLKPDGRLIITVPDESVAMSVPMNPEHVHAFTHESLLSLTEIVGLSEIDFENGYNGVSFTSVFVKNGSLKRTEKFKLEVLSSSA